MELTKLSLKKPVKSLKCLNLHCHLSLYNSVPLYIRLYVIAIQILQKKIINSSFPKYIYKIKILLVIAQRKKAKEYLSCIQRNKRNLFFPKALQTWILGNYFLPALKTAKPGTKKLIRKELSLLLLLGKEHLVLQQASYKHQETY